jgi:hypothetical protein
MEITKNTTTSLKSILDAKKADFNTSATDEKKKLYAEGIAAVQSSGEEKLGGKISVKSAVNQWTKFTIELIP